MIEFTVPGEPTGKGRPRFTKSGGCYTPDRTANYEQLVQYCYMTAYNRPARPLTGPVMLEIDVYHAIPKRITKTDRSALSYPMKTPDLDNVIKIIGDSVNKIAYEDDKQIVAIIARKYYADVGRVEVRIGAL